VIGVIAGDFGTAGRMHGQQVADAYRAKALLKESDELVFVHDIHLLGKKTATKGAFPGVSFY
jgi:hypothetical protein